MALLNGNRPQLYEAAYARFPSLTKNAVPPGVDSVEAWDAEDFDPWSSLRWGSVRLTVHRQRKPEGPVVAAYWLPDYAIQEVDSQ